MKSYIFQIIYLITKHAQTHLERPLALGPMQIKFLLKGPSQVLNQGSTKVPKETPQKPMNFGKPRPTLRWALHV